MELDEIQMTIKEDLDKNANAVNISKGFEDWTPNFFHVNFEKAESNES